MMLELLAHIIWPDTPQRLKPNRFPMPFSIRGSVVRQGFVGFSVFIGIVAVCCLVPATAASAAAWAAFAASESRFAPRARSSRMPACTFAWPPSADASRSEATACPSRADDESPIWASAPSW